MSQTPHITQAMILAAGKGTRLRPLTLTTPKPLVEVGGQPLIVWHIKALKAAGITDIAINTSWLSDKLMSALGNGEQYGVTIHWSVEEGEPLKQPAVSPKR
nr:sugar phosphate nucleotidyltransferase [Psychrobacter sp. PraFG1]